ncbi:MAG: hypothetical protein EA426_13130 [Spirochaetaceae bacterium]|nr:MAG: hypothetical protein EA426_13130 [Spirochaetaceae bacterium]
MVRMRTYVYPYRMSDDKRLGYRPDGPRGPGGDPSGDRWPPGGGAAYGGGTGLWGGVLTPLEAGSLSSAPAVDEAFATESDLESDGESHLRSTREVAGYWLQASEQKAGVVTDFVIEDTTWAIRYLLVETDDEIGGAALFISPHWVREISWIERRISIEMPLEQLRDVPKVGAGGAPSRDEEEHLHEFFGKTRYWK